MAAVSSFPPIAAPDVCVLILGSMPGERSLAAGRYYAHPANAFWPIVAEFLGCGAEAPYAARVRALRAGGLALWDVLRSCERTGSLDAAIVRQTMATNDFGRFFARHRRIATVLCNGATAHDLFVRRVLPELGARAARLAVVRLPSTSPAHAGMPPAQKRAVWLAALRDAGGFHDGRDVARCAGHDPL